MVGRYGGFSFGGQQPKGLSPLNKMPAGTTFPNGAKTAILLTFDVEGHYGNGGGSQDKEIANYRRICGKLAQEGVPATFNVVGQMVDECGSDFVKWMLDAGCEVASHGYWHDLNRVFDGDKIYAGQYGVDVNTEQIKRGVDALEKIQPGIVNGIRLPYGHFNEFTYEVIEQLGLKWTSNVGIDDFIVDGYGYGPMPFQMRLGEREYDIVEIPLDSQTYDWSIWVADETTNKTFVDAARAYCEGKGIEFERTPAGAVKIWKQRIADAVQQQSVFTLLCHPINLTVEGERWDDAVDEFMLPVIEHIGELAGQNKIWVCTCNEMATYYNKISN